jgi:hypothetical protein
LPSCPDQELPPWAHHLLLLHDAHVWTSALCNAVGRGRMPQRFVVCLSLVQRNVSNGNGLWLVPSTMRQVLVVPTMFWWPNQCKSLRVFIGATEGVRSNRICGHSYLFAIFREFKQGIPCNWLLFDALLIACTLTAGVCMAECINC